MNCPICESSIYDGRVCQLCGYGTEDPPITANEKCAAVQPLRPVMDEAPENPPAIFGGMSLHDWFAGQAMQGMLSRSDDASVDVSFIVSMSYKYADAMLTARSKTK